MPTPGGPAFRLRRGPQGETPSAASAVSSLVIPPRPVGGHGPCGDSRCAAVIAVRKQGCCLDFVDASSPVPGASCGSRMSVLIVACVGALSLSAFGLGATHQMVLVAARMPAPSDFPTRRGHHHFFWDDNSGSFSGTAVHGPLAWTLGLCAVIVPLAIG